MGFDVAGLSSGQSLTETKLVTTNVRQMKMLATRSRHKLNKKGSALSGKVGICKHNQKSSSQHQKQKHGNAMKLQKCNEIEMN